MPELKSVVRFALVFSFMSALVWAQAITSQIKGTVQDASGLGVPGATVKATQTDTGAVRNVETAADGGYLFQALPIGPYQLEIAREGFAKYLQTGIVLQVDTNPTIDAVLKVGALSDQIEVAASAAMVETQSSGIGQVIDSQRVVDLPLNGRTVTDLINLTAGVVSGRGTRTNYPSEATPSVAGGTATSIAYSLDGGTHNDPLSSQNLPLPFPDAIQEFKVETSALPAQYGYHATGAVNVITKSGGNAFHGDGFEFVRNYLFNARNTFQPTRDSLKRNQYGGTVGGPIRKNKLFFFTGWQGTIQRSNPTATPSFIPTPAVLTGNFQTEASTQCQTRAITLPASLGFVNNTISPSLFSPVALALAAKLPATSDPCGRILIPGVASQSENQGLARVDYQLNSSHTLFARYFITNLLIPPGSASGNVFQQAISGTADRVQTLTLGETYVINPHTVNSLRLTANRSVSTNVLNSYFSLASLGVNIYQLPPPTPPVIGGITVTNGFTIATNPSNQPYDTVEVSEDMSLTKGPHQITLGVNYINMKAFAINALNANGNFTFNGGATGVGLADFLLGVPFTFIQDVPSYSDQHQNFFALYAQDSWKVSRRLSVSMGLRWDPFFAHTNPYDEVVQFSMAAFLANTRSKVFPNAPAGELFDGDPGGPANKKYTSNKLSNFSPRIGLVWDPNGDGRMTIRAAYGMFYDLPNFAFDQFGFAQPFGAILTVQNPASFANPWASYPGGNPYPGNVGGGSKTQVFQPNSTVFSYPQKVQPTYINQWNLSIQKQIGNWLLTANYLGNSSIHLWVGNETNPAIYIPGNCVAGQFGLTAPGPCSTTANTLQRRVLSQINPNQLGPNIQFYGPNNILDEGGTANYNGLLLSATHRYSSHFTSTSNLTWSHCISDNYTLAIGLTPFSDEQPNNRRADRGNCNTADHRVAFNQTVVAASPRYSNHVLRLVAGDWRLAVSAIVQTGGFFHVLTGNLDQALTGNAANQRVNQVQQNVFAANPGQLNGWLNLNAFAQPALGTYGNTGVNNILGPGLFTINTALSRSFPVREHQQLEVRGEAFNLPNIVNLNNPTATLNSPLFGKITTAGDPRIMQFAVKYTF
jgi:hypothetical protein